MNIRPAAAPTTRYDVRYSAPAAEALDAISRSQVEQITAHLRELAELAALDASRTGDGLLWFEQSGFRVSYSVDRIARQLAVAAIDYTG